MNKCFISRRPSGLGDLICNLGATYFFAKKYNGNMSVDWRKIVYNSKGDFVTMKDNPSNLFNCIFIQPEEINGVKFISPESDSIIWNYTSIPDLKVRHKYISEDENKKETDMYESLIKDNNYLNVEQRVHESNQIWKELHHANFKINSIDGTFIEDFNLVNFIEKIKIQPNVKEKIDSFYEKNFVGNNIIAIHMRYGNSKNKEPLHRPHKDDKWIEDDVLINTIKKTIDSFSLSEYKCFISCDNERVNTLLLNNIDHSFCYNKKFPDYKDGSIHMNANENPIQIFQESFIDMILLSKANKIICTAHSVFSVFPALKITNDYKNLEHYRLILSDYCI